jgi:hypothetical protein
MFWIHEEFIDLLDARLPMPAPQQLLEGIPASLDKCVLQPC